MLFSAQNVVFFWVAHSDAKVASKKDKLRRVDLIPHFFEIFGHAFVAHLDILYGEKAQLSCHAYHVQRPDQSRIVHNKHLKNEGHQIE